MALAPGGGGGDLAEPFDSVVPGEFFAEKARVALRDDRNADALALARRGVAWEKKNPFLYGYLGEAEHFLTLTATDEPSARMLHEMHPSIIRRP